MKKQLKNCSCFICSCNCSRLFCRLFKIWRRARQGKRFKKAKFGIVVQTGANGAFVDMKDGIIEEMKKTVMKTLSLTTRMRKAIQQLLRQLSTLWTTEVMTQSLQSALHARKLLLI